MKNTFKVFGIIALVVIIGFSMTACSRIGMGNPFIGTWMNEYGEKIVFTDSNFFLSEASGGAETGEYIRDGNTAYIQDTFSSSTITAVVSGRTMNLLDKTWTKQ